MSLARDIADLGAVTSRLDTVGGSSGALSNRNLIINGGMQVAQRGTSHAAVASLAFTLDRFSFSHSQDGAFTVTQDSSGPAGFANSLKLDVTTADSSLAAGQYLLMEHKIEAQNLQQLAFGTSSAKNFTLSFYVKSNKTGTYAVNVMHEDNSSILANLTYTINSANTWERKTLTFTGDTTGAINDDNGSGFKMGFGLAMGGTYTSGDTSASFRTFANANYGAGQTVNILDSTSNEWFITGVQLEVGDTATDFEHRTFGDELIKCERYLQKRGTDTSGWEFLADAGQLVSATAFQVAVRFRQKMRAAPTFSYTGNLSDIYMVRASAIHAISSVNMTDNTNGNTVLLTGAVANTSGSAGEQTRMQTQAAGTNFFFDAEV